MAVVVRYMCTRDGKMFEDRKQANAHDKMLESVELLRDLIEASAVAGVDENLADELAYYLVSNKDETMAALRGQSAKIVTDKPQALTSNSHTRDGYNHVATQS